MELNKFVIAIYNAQEYGLFEIYYGQISKIDHTTFQMNVFARCIPSESSKIIIGNYDFPTCEIQKTFMDYSIVQIGGKFDWKTVNQIINEYSAQS